MGYPDGRVGGVGTVGVRGMTDEACGGMLHREVHVAGDS